MEAVCFGGPRKTLYSFQVFTDFELKMGEYIIDIMWGVEFIEVHPKEVSSAPWLCRCAQGYLDVRTTWLLHDSKMETV